MNDNKNIKYADMVAALVKDGEAIRASLTPELCHMAHMAVGLSGECSEVLECVLNAGEYHSRGDFLRLFDRKNAVKELGDVEFYFFGLIKATSATIVFPEVTPSSVGGDPLRLVASLSVYGGNVLDAVKKAVIYGKALEDAGFFDSLANLTLTLAETYLYLNISRQEALDANMKKLLTGETARYKLGTYTDAQAVKRADKLMEQT